MQVTDDGHRRSHSSASICSNNLVGTRRSTRHRTGRKVRLDELQGTVRDSYLHSNVSVYVVRLAGTVDYL